MVIIFVALFGGVFFLLQRILYAHFWNKGVQVQLSFEKEMVQAGDEIKLFEVVENDKKLPLSSLKVKFQCSRHLIFSDRENGNVTDQYYRNDLFSIMPYHRVTRTHRILCPKRGYYGIHGIDLVGADLFFSQEMMDSRESDASLYVIPHHCRLPGWSRQYDESTVNWRSEAMLSRIPLPTGGSENMNHLMR